ncbi:Hypothetical predicted protein [Octopus vulgaris]|uniref:Uncharacterized protein n=1 Tax=Octopus vulgaris TaxID=6645 RepID=A0AA36F3Z4_OCTVU|nr:Hypothetical predicted protein [Octopus vulgaris]
MNCSRNGGERERAIHTHKMKENTKNLEQKNFELFFLLLLLILMLLLQLLLSVSNSDSEDQLNSGCLFSCQQFEAPKPHHCSPPPPLACDFLLKWYHRQKALHMSNTYMHIFV